MKQHTSQHVMLSGCARPWVAGGWHTGTFEGDGDESLRACGAGQGVRGVEVPGDEREAGVFPSVPQEGIECPAVGKASVPRVGVELGTGDRLMIC